MILVVNSLPKCASTWTFHVVDACLRDLGHSSVFDVAPWTNRWGNPGPLEGDNLRRLLSIDRTYGIKAHVPNTPELSAVHEDGRMRTVFLVRHPLDVVSATLDYGARKRQIGERDNPYYDIHTVEQALGFCSGFWSFRDTWLDHALMVRYEDLVADYEAALGRIFRHFSLPDPWPRVQAAIARSVDAFSPERLMSGTAPRGADHIRLNLLTRGAGAASATPTASTRRATNWATSSAPGDTRTDTAGA